MSDDDPASWWWKQQEIERDHAKYEAEAWEWWTGGAAQQAQRSDDADPWEENKRIYLARQSSAPSLPNPSLPRGCVTYAVVVLALAFATEYAITLLQHSVVFASAVLHMQPPVGVLAWIFVSGRIFPAFASIYLFLCWLRDRFSRLRGAATVKSFTGRVIWTTIGLGVIAVVSGSVAALLIVWQHIRVA